MKICLVSPYDFMHPGGVTEHVRHLSAKLRARGHDVTVLAPSSRVGDDHGIPGYVRIGRSVPVRTNGSVARIALSFHLVRRVRALLDENHFDVVHYHEPLVPVAADHRAALSQRRECRHLPRDGPAQPRLLLRQAVPQALLQPASRARGGERAGARLHRAVLRRRVPGRPQRHRLLAIQRRIIPSSRSCARPGKATILFVGRLESRKGLPTLLEAYGQLRRVRDDARLVVVGDGPMRWGYESQVAAMGIPDVEFAGRVSSELLPRYYASADIFCAPATGGESFGIVLLEAMASGVPVIASSIPGFSSVIAHDVDGVLVPPRHPKEWAAALGALLDDPARREGDERARARQGAVV